MGLDTSPTAVKHRDCWRYFVSQAAPDQRTPGNWAMFLAGWLAKAQQREDIRNNRPAPGRGNV